MTAERFDYRDHTEEATQPNKNLGRIIKKYAPALVLASGLGGFIGGAVDSNVVHPNAVQTQLDKEGLHKPTKEEVIEADATTKVFGRIAIQDTVAEGSFTPSKKIAAYIKEANTTLANDKAFEVRKDAITENGMRKEGDSTAMLIGMAATVSGGAILYTRRPRRG